MRHLILVLTMLGAVGTQNLGKTTTADTLRAGNPNATMLCCGGPTCLPGDPCGGGGPRFKIS
jgi:hypothetical protein